MADIGAEDLVEALKQGKLRNVERLLNAGVNPNSLVEYGTVTPMHLAAGLGLEPICLLLQYGGDPNICIQDRTTPLHVAAMWGDADSVQILLANGGDPFRKDLDSMSALDLADQYHHADVQTVIQHYRTLLSAGDRDQTITPKFTYFRRNSLCSSASSQQSDSLVDPDPDVTTSTADNNVDDVSLYNSQTFFGKTSLCSSASSQQSDSLIDPDPDVTTNTADNNVDDVSLYNSQTLHNYLQDFTKRRRSSVYLRSIQRQVDRFFGDGRRTHLVDVTSPDHPYIEARFEDRAEYEPGDQSCDQSYDSSFDTPHGKSRDQSLNLHLSLSEDEQSTCDSFVTCDGEDLETMLNNSEEESPFNRSLDCKNSVKKNPKFNLFPSPKQSFNNNNSCSLESTVTENATDWQGRQLQRNWARGDNSCSSESTITENTTWQGRRSSVNRSRGDKYCRREPLFKPAELDDSESQLQKCDYCGCLAGADPERDDIVCKTCEKLDIELDKMMLEASVKEKKHNVHTEKEKIRKILENEEDRNFASGKPLSNFFQKLDKGLSEENLPDLVQTRGRQPQPYLDVVPNSKTSRTREFQEDRGKSYVTVGKNHNASRDVPKREAFTELSKQLRRTSFTSRPDDFDDRSENFEMKTASNRNVKEHDANSCNSNFSQSSQGGSNRADVGFCKSDLGDSLISSDSTFLQAPIQQARFHPSDISTISIDDNYHQDRDALDQAYMDTTASTIHGDGYGSVKMTRRKRSEPINDLQRAQPGNEHDLFTDKRRSVGNVQRWKEDLRQSHPSPNSDQSPEINDLWSEVRASTSSMKRRGLGRRREVLDTAFCGRESVGSIQSDASTVTYVYTDNETGIVLLEKHIPSQCGSSGSRRSLDSLFSQNTNERSFANGSPKNEIADANTSQDTVLYTYHDDGAGDDATVNEASDDDTRDVDYPVSPDLLNFDDQTLRQTFVDMGHDPGPITKTTRQAYLRRLSQMQNDPSGNWLNKKGPEFPPELRLALSGSLDLSEMSALEAKMVSTFQNPDRARRWREGTLKSSFNYILLDPRVTRDLPNRAPNMSDLEVFKTFVKATIYVGKGKRARPYCHLYEAIKEMKKPSGKTSDKVSKILEIWGGDQGVVSLHCFQSVIPVEAYTREACMVDAIGLSHLTNKKRGDYYGVSTTFSMKQRRKMGVYLLSKALQIFLAEGERQISPLDIKNDP